MPLQDMLLSSITLRLFVTIFISVGRVTSLLDMFPLSSLSCPALIRASNHVVLRRMYHCYLGFGNTFTYTSKNETSIIATT